jgi:hypothetical protein
LAPNRRSFVLARSGSAGRSQRGIHRDRPMHFLSLRGVAAAFEGRPITVVEQVCPQDSGACCDVTGGDDASNMG